MDYYSPFWGPVAIFLVDEPQGALTSIALTLTILANSGPFCGLLVTVFWSRVIYLIAEPLGALTYHSSTLTILADSDPFHGLLLTVLGSRSDFLG